MQIACTIRNLNSYFNIKDQTKFEHQHEIVYLINCLHPTFNEIQIGEHFLTEKLIASVEVTTPIYSNILRKFKINTEENKF